jgi:hypothetical protein
VIRRFRWPLAALALFSILWPQVAVATVAALIAAVGAVCVWVAVHPSVLAFALGTATPRIVRRIARIRSVR